MTAPWCHRLCAGRMRGIGSINTDTAASPSEYTICETLALRPAKERFNSVSLRNPAGCCLTTHPVSAGVSAMEKAE
ncbi:hypothetical protein D3C83_33190 [compost metagenome]